MAVVLLNGISELDVAMMAKSFGIVFPPEYAAFLNKYNGMFIGSGSYCTIPFSKVDNGKVDFQELYGINTKNPSFDLVKANDIRSEIVAFKHPFVIGSDPGGNPFLMNCNVNDEAVYYWDRTHLHCDNNYDYHENSEEGNIYKIFDSFVEFYDGIVLNIDGDNNILRELL